VETSVIVRSSTPVTPLSHDSPPVLQERIRKSCARPTAAWGASIFRDKTDPV
jgi:hypothetical protein